LSQPGVLGRIDYIKAARQHRDCPASGRKGTLVGNGINAACQPTGNCDAVAYQVARQFFGDLFAVNRSVAGAHDRQAPIIFK
jgi:hypothetical protein